MKTLAKAALVTALTLCGASMALAADVPADQPMPTQGMKQHAKATGQTHKKAKRVKHRQKHADHKKMQAS